MTTEHTPRILVVDDEAPNRALFEALLAPEGYEIFLAENGEEALIRAEKDAPDVILLDVMMPAMDGFETARRLKQNEQTRIIPIVMVTSLSDVEDRVRALEAGADDFLSKPVDKTELRVRVKTLLTVKAYNDHQRDHQKELEQAVTARTKELQHAMETIKASSLDTILRLARAAEFRDEETGAHIVRMSHFSAAVARKMGLGDERAETVLYASPMHDVGKIAIPDSILRKPATLDRDEWTIMKRHTTYGARILEGSESPVIRMAETIAITHHEKWDGSGYPAGLVGEDIPLEGRITAVADVFDALTSRRPYKEPFPIDKSLEMIREKRGNHFDPDVVDAFFAIKDDILDIREANQEWNIGGTTP